jgi:hypothetical protein
MAASSNIKLWLSFSGTSKLALSIPVDRATAFAVYPLKWLRFLGYAIYGREGHLSTSRVGSEIDDYAADIEARSYHFIAQGKLECHLPSFLLTLLTISGEPLLVDVDAIDDRTSDASDLSTRRANFRERLIARDGICVMSNERAGYCTACHIIPHSKGSNVRS